MGILFLSGLSSCGPDDDAEVLFTYTVEFPVDLPFNGDVFLTQLVDVGNVPNEFNQRREALGIERSDITRLRVSRAFINLIDGENDLFFMRRVNMGVYAFSRNQDLEIAFRDLEMVNGGSSIQLFPSLPDVTDILELNTFGVTLEYIVRDRNVPTQVEVAIEVQAVREM